MIEVKPFDLERDAESFIQLINRSKEYLQKHGVDRIGMTKDGLRLLDQNVRVYLLWNGDQIVGEIDLFFIEGDKAELGFWLAEDMTGKGVMSELLPRFCRDSGVKELVVHTANPAAVRVCVKTGFTHVPGQTVTCLGRELECYYWKK